MDNLIALSGSEKQIAWASTIRAKLAPQISAHLDHIAERRALIEGQIAKYPGRADLVEDLRATDSEATFLRAVLLVSAASFWIDRKNNDGRGLWSSLASGTCRKYGLPPCAEDFDATERK